MPEYYVYKYVKPNGKIIYVGRTKSLAQRVAMHRRELPMDCSIYAIHCSGLATATALEALLINKYKPEYNRMFLESTCFSDTKVEDISFIEPEWKSLENCIKVEEDCKESLPTEAMIKKADTKYNNYLEFLERKDNNELWKKIICSLDSNKDLSLASGEAIDIDAPGYYHFELDIDYDIPIKILKCYIIAWSEKVDAKYKDYVKYCAPRQIEVRDKVNSYNGKEVVDNISMTDIELKSVANREVKQYFEGLLNEIRLRDY